MSIQATYNGAPMWEARPLLLTGTSNTDVYTATSNNELCAGFSIANSSASGVAISVFYYNLTDTTSYLIWRGTIAADGATIIDNLPQRLRTGDKITATAATGNVLTIKPFMMRQGRTEQATAPAA